MYLAKHAFIRYNAQSKVINLERMVLSIDNLGRHVSRSPRSVFIVFFFHNPGYPHISQPQVPFLVNYDILWFDVSVNDVIAMHVLKAQKDAANKKFYDMLWKSLPLSNLVPQIPAWQIIHDQVKVRTILKRINHIH